MNEVVVGYTSNRKKQKHFFDGLAKAAERWVGAYGPARTPVSVRLVPLCDCDHIPHPHRLRLHAVVHKRTDDMAAAVAGGDRAAADRIDRLHKLLGVSLPLPPPLLRESVEPEPQVRPERFKLVAVDSLEGVWRLVDRRLISEAVDRAFGAAKVDRCNGCCDNVCTLAWTQVPLRKGANAIRNALHGKLDFPIILKRRLACGTKASHEMVIAYDMDGTLAAVKAVFGAEEPLQPSGVPGAASQGLPTDDFGSHVIAQEFIANHGGVLFKVYAIGTNVVVQPRASVQHNIKGPDGGYYYFDSQRLNRGDQGDHFAFDPATGCSKATEAIMPSPKLSASIVADLSHELGLSLIGVDIVYDINTKNYYVVDINYFPGYKGVSTAYEWILEHICNLVWQRLEEH